MQQAVDESGASPQDVDYINAHGTATADNDSAEAKAIKAVFAGNDHVKVSSTKSMTGHLLGAAGAIEAVAVVGAIQKNQMPVNVGISHQDEECPVNLVTEENKKSPG